MGRKRFPRLMQQMTLAGVVACSPLMAHSLMADTSTPALWQASKQKRNWQTTLNASQNQQLDLGLQLAAQGRAIQLIFTTADENQTTVNLLQLALRRDKEGAVLNAGSSHWIDGKWQNSLQTRLIFGIPSTPKNDAANMEADGVKPQNWPGRTIPVQIHAQPDALRIWVEGKLVAQYTGPINGEVQLTFTGDEGDSIVSSATSNIQGGWQYHTVNLSPAVNTQLPEARKLPKLKTPLSLVEEGRRILDLRNARWIDAPRNPSSYYERYDSGQYFLGDDRMPMVQLPQADYVAVHVLAAVDPDPGLSKTLTLRMGRYNTSSRGQALQYDFAAQLSPTRDGQELQLFRIPLTRAFAQDILDGVIDVELTKEVRLARRSPDPNRFRWRPLGLPSGVRIAAITFERSPLQMTVTSSEGGHLFVEPQRPTFTVKLQNISPEKQAFTLSAKATHFYGSEVSNAVRGEVAPGQTQEVTLPIPASVRGYHDVNIQLQDAKGRVLLDRKTSFAVLPDARRPHHNDSPVGVWDFCGGHLTPNDPELTGPMYQKLGLRYGMFHYEPAVREKYGVIKGNEFSVRVNHKAEDVVSKYKELKEKHPDLLSNFLIFHEDSISGRHVTRTPDLFHDREPFVLDADEKKRFDMMYELAVESARRIREYDPNIRISIGNGPMPLREELYRRGFPKELFDNAGNEAGVFARPPEAQPPDIVSNNASIWMDRQLLDHYGYKDHGIAQCYEITYPSTNPGNLSHETQAAYFIRHILHGMTWGMPQLRVGSLTDMANSYYFSNWGSSGIFNKWPEINPKPAAVALGTMTWVLDGAKFDHKIDMGSDSLFGLQFKRADGKNVLAMWTIRGKRDVTVNLTRTTQATLIDSQGIETALKVDGGKAQVTLSGDPVYLVIDGLAQSGIPGKATYAAAPQSKVAVVSPLQTLKGWKVSDERNIALEVYSPMEPRRKGNFKFEEVAEFEGRKKVIRVTPGPLATGKATMPMYAELVPDKPIELPGKPTELGVWVNGNSSWGRIIFSFVDAKGQTWTSIGAPGKSGNRWLADWLPPEMLEKYNPEQNADWNTDDSFGLSRIDFDGWRYVGIALPGQYPGGEYHWPSHSQWRFDQDGIVAYPIKLTSVTVQLPEKTLHVQDFRPARRPEIYLSNLVVSEDPAVNEPKTASEEYVRKAQSNGL